VRQFVNSEQEAVSSYYSELLTVYGSQLTAYCLCLT
jgi:hypothetical protein